MKGVRLADLSPAARKQVLEAEGKPAKKARKGASSRLEGWCQQCSARIESEKAWDRHWEATGCRRRLSCLPLSTPPRNGRQHSPTEASSVDSPHEGADGHTDG